MLITDIRDDTLEETAKYAEKINGKAEILLKTADIGKDGVAEQLVETVVKHFGRLDYALNVAGIVGDMEPITTLSKESYSKVQDVNAKAVWLCERAQIAQMLRQDALPTQLATPPHLWLWTTMSAQMLI